ncbi:hypothetical protein CDL15_Pgr011281 [Punica granatum]|uniref:Uncharacterized protein n=1 Tax=Punica granatum TaxID=22663 RepID=A0A218WE71_PUNGR|nr:hypothetical protein CDL15_Pgr011281 [Punica granatum]
MESGSTPGNPTETNSKWSSEEEEDLLDRSVTRAKNVEGGRSETVQEDEILEGNLMGKSALMETDMERRGVRFKPRSFNMGVSEVGGVRRLVDSEAMLVEEQSKGSETAVRSEGSGVVNFNSVIPASLDPDPDPGKKLPCAEAEKINESESFVTILEAHKPITCPFNAILGS